MGGLNNMEESINAKEKIMIYRDERKGIWTIMVFYLLSWGMIALSLPAMRLVGWVCLGLIGLALWKIFDNLFQRTEEEMMDENKVKGRSKKSGR